MEFFLIYLYVILDRVISGVAVISLLFVGFLYLAKILYGGEGDHKEQWVNEFFDKWAKTAVTSAVILFVCAILVPTKKEMAYIIGGGVVWKISQDEEVQELPHNIAKMAEDFSNKANR